MEVPAPPLATPLPRGYVTSPLLPSLLPSHPLPAGTDLQGNTFWEFRPSASSPTHSTSTHRLRRIVQYAKPTHYSDVTITPQWHQWLRHTRLAPPSLQEQIADVERQRNLKQLARLADERWASKPSFLDQPKDGSSEHPQPALRVQDRGAYAAPDGGPGRADKPEDDRVKSAIRGEDGQGGLPRRETEEGRKQLDGSEDKNPWDIKRGAPSEEWQPEAWDPNSVKPRART